MRGPAIEKTLLRAEGIEGEAGKTVDDLNRAAHRVDEIASRMGNAATAGKLGNVASHLHRFISPRLAKKIATDVTKHDIALAGTADKNAWPPCLHLTHVRSLLHPLQS